MVNIIGNQNKIGTHVSRNREYQKFHMNVKNFITKKINKFYKMRERGIIHKYHEHKTGIIGT